MTERGVALSAVLGVTIDTVQQYSGVTERGVALSAVQGVTIDTVQQTAV